MIGAEYDLPNGGLVYIAFRTPEEVWAGGLGDIGEATRQGIDGWALNDEHVREIMRDGVTRVGVYIRRTKELWLTPARHYYDKATYKYLSHAGKGVPPQRMVLRSMGHTSKPPVKVRARKK